MNNHNLCQASRDNSERRKQSASQLGDYLLECPVKQEKFTLRIQASKGLFGMIADALSKRFTIALHKNLSICC